MHEHEHLMLMIIFIWIVISRVQTLSHLMSDVAAGRMDKVVHVGHIPRELPGTFFTEGKVNQQGNLQY